jgi:hypothetical protein
MVARGSLGRVDERLRERLDADQTVERIMGEPGRGEELIKIDANDIEVGEGRGGSSMWVQSHNLGFSNVKKQNLIAGQGDGPMTPMQEKEITTTLQTRCTSWDEGCTTSPDRNQGNFPTPTKTHDQSYLLKSKGPSKYSENIFQTYDNAPKPGPKANPLNSTYDDILKNRKSTDFSHPIGQDRVKPTFRNMRKWLRPKSKDPLPIPNTRLKNPKNFNNKSTLTLPSNPSNSTNTQTQTQKKNPKNAINPNSDSKSATQDPLFTYKNSPHLDLVSEGKPYRKVKGKKFLESYHSKFLSDRNTGLLHTLPMKKLNN